MRIDVHSHLVSLDFIKHLQGRGALPNAVIEGGAYLVSCTSTYQNQGQVHYTDVEKKLRDMERMGVDMSVLSHGIPGPELLGGVEADDWASRINDYLAATIDKYPGKFLGWGSIGFGSVDRSIAEVDRCIHQLGFKGIHLFSNTNQKTLDSPEFIPVYRHIAGLGAPINMHPTAPLNLVAAGEPPLVPSFGFIFDTSLATVRLIMSGLFDQAPDLKLIVPHVGGVLPYLRGRIEWMVDAWASSKPKPPIIHSSKHYLDKIYVDTVAHSVEALEYCYRTLGPRKILYGTDHPFGNYATQAEMVEQLDCSESDRELIYHGNAEGLLGL